MNKDKTLLPKAKHALYAALTGIIVSISILFIKIIWVAIAGLFIGFGLSIVSIFMAAQALKSVNRQKEKYRGDNMAWIALILGILLFLSLVPFIIEFTGRLF